MQKLILIAIILVSGFTSAQTNFEKGMLKAFALWQDNKMDDAENMFERISKAETQEWLPHYYIAQINSLKSWDVKDEAVLRAHLEKAQAHINRAMAISKENPETLVMQAHVLTNWVAFDGMSYGMKYSGKITELYSKAEKLSPNNPRVMYCKAEWAMNSAKYFGQDTKPFCAAIEKAIELFATFKPESDLHPIWGKERAEQITKSCKE
jgi:hypothetical protein